MQSRKLAGPIVFLAPERRSHPQGDGSGAGFMPEATGTPIGSGARAASPAAAISDAIVGLLHDYTGRGPTKARTTIGPDTIVVTLRNCLTKAERRLCRQGHAPDVLAMRRKYQTTMRDDLIAAVERLTGGTVEAFLSDNLDDPDLAVEIFLMHPDNDHTLISSDA